MTPFVEELIPSPDPWEVARKLAHLPGLLFLDSAESHPERGRYSYVMAEPAAWITRRATPATAPAPAPTFEAARKLIEGFGRPVVPGLPPFQGGVAGVFGYGINRELERISANRDTELSPPELAIGRYDWVISFDHCQSRAWFIGQCRGNWDMIRAELTKPLPPFPPYPTNRSIDTHRSPQYSLPGVPGVFSNFSPEGYRNAVRRAVGYVHAGDCFQVNLSQRLRTKLREHPLELYGRLRRFNPAPFACYFDAGDFQILSASPERFSKVSPSGQVTTTPIKGTRPRGRTPDEDAALIRELTSSAKDRAENVMIVDLLRNDLGRVCEYGSIEVPRVCDVESYRFVHHLVSEVRGQIRAGLTPFDLLRAAFPGGSVTGAPKVRAMEIIAELEPTARGPYCGSVGFVGFDSAMDTNILIRTFTAYGGWLQFPVGGGIVADSNPDREYEETLHKAAGLLNALRS